VNTELSPRPSPLDHQHRALGARLVPFAGWAMPVLYSSIQAEHAAVREALGIFDISHMGQLIVRGDDAAAWLDALLTNQASALQPGRGHYTLLLNPDGGVIDDLILYRLDPLTFLLIVNAARTADDLAQLQAHLQPGISLLDLASLSPRAGLAVQGPRAPEFCQAFFGMPMPARNRITQATPSHGGSAEFFCGTGYTGEKGFEWFGPACSILPRWDAALALMAQLGGLPNGLGARDSLRLEMAYPLNGQDLDAHHSPLEAGLSFAVRLQKDFVGATALRQQLTGGLPSKLVGLSLPPKAPPPRRGYTLHHHGQPVAQLTSGGLSPSLGHGIALAYLPPHLASPGTQLDLEIRSRTFPATVVTTPFYKSS